jgi:hypothetical protein
MTGLAVAAFGKSAALEHLAQFFQHRRAAAHHDAVLSDIQSRLADIVEQLFGGDQISDAAAVAKRFAADGRVIDKLLGQQRAEYLVIVKFRYSSSP